MALLHFFETITRKKAIAATVSFDYRTDNIRRGLILKALLMRYLQGNNHTIDGQPESTLDTKQTHIKIDRSGDENFFYPHNKFQMRSSCQWTTFAVNSKSEFTLGNLTKVPISDQIFDI